MEAAGESAIDAGEVGGDNGGGETALDNGAGVEPPDFVGEGAEGFGVGGGGDDEVAGAAALFGLLEPGEAVGGGEGGEIFGDPGGGWGRGEGG